MRYLHLKLLLSVSALLMSLHSFAESEDFGAYTVHYIAVNSTFISADIARQYDIVRGKRNAFLNISILRNNDDGSTTPVTAQVQGTKNNLLQQSSTIEFREIHEGQAIYYLGQFDFSNAEILRFKVEVQPEPSIAAHSLEWTTQLYAD